jgi:hypothetical protein
MTDPLVWPLARLTLDEETGETLKASIHAGHNDDMMLDVDELSLVGRTTLLRGPAEKIIVLSPLVFAAKTLSLDPSVGADIAALEGRVTALEARATAIETRLAAYDAAFNLAFDTLRVVAGIFTFSNNNLTVTKATNNAVWNLAFSQYHSSIGDRLYFEATPVFPTGTPPMIGLARRQQSVVGYPGDVGGNSIGWTSLGEFYVGGSGSAPQVAPWTSGQTIGIAMDVGAGRYWFRNVSANSSWNGSTANHPDTAPQVGAYGDYDWGSKLAIACAIYNTGHSWTINPNGPFVGALPTGYRALNGRFP